jgi:hypothetical protein
MRITAKQFETIATLIPEEAADNFSLAITQPKGKTSLRVQDGKVTYKVKADGSIEVGSVVKQKKGGKRLIFKAPEIEPQSISAEAELAAARAAEPSRANM